MMAIFPSNAEPAFALSQTLLGISSFSFEPSSLYRTGPIPCHWAGWADSQHLTALTTSSSTEELIGQAEQLKVSLRETLSKTSELIVGLKRHRKEAKIVRTTLDSLRQLQTVS